MFSSVIISHFLLAAGALAARVREGKWPTLTGKAKGLGTHCFACLRLCLGSSAVEPHRALILHPTSLFMPQS